jgi:peptidoglycan DL-endopeptidase CwlO
MLKQRAKSSIRITRLLLTAVVLFSFTAPVYADQFDDQINAIKNEISGQQAEINRLRREGNTLANKVAGLNAEIARANNELALSRAQYTKLSAELAAAEQKLTEKKTTLDENVRTIYLEGQVTPIEVLASSGSLSEYLDHQNYLEKLKESVTSAIAEVTALKAQLETQRTQQARLIGEQQVLEEGLQAQRNEVATLLAETRGEEAAYQSQVATNNQRITQLKAQQAAAIAANSRRVGGGSGCGGYPAIWCNSPQDSMVDSWGMYNRECVSYAAWAVADRFGKHMPYWGGRGNANQWPANADAAGIPRDGSPRVGDVAIYMGGFYGHAMIVEEVRGSTVVVSNFNADNTGQYSVDEWSTSSLTFIHF